MPVFRFSVPPCHLRWQRSSIKCRPALHGPVGSGPRYMISVTLFCTLRESENTRTCENCTRFACNSCMSVCFLTRATCKNVRQNLIPRATAYGPALQVHGPALQVHGPALQVHGPALQVHGLGPALQVHGPALQVHGPALHRPASLRRAGGAARCGSCWSRRLPHHLRAEGLHGAAVSLHDQFHSATLDAWFHVHVE